ncbi:MAG: thioredoxin family protein [Candidatus Planktophila sp.]|nr:thioredoxin family protein [Candidatus Planktophila sp.]
MESLLPIVIVLALASAYGFWHKRTRGKIVVKSDKGLISAAMIGGELGTRATLLQFSSAFCGPCRATRLLIEDVTADMADVAHVEVDAEANLELVRRLDIRSTPTTLFLDSAGHEVGRAVGAPKRDQVVKAIAAIA